MAALSSPSTAVEHGLALAVVASSNAPLLLLDGNLTILAASTSFCVAYQLDLASVRGRQLSELGAGEWNVPQLISLLRATISGSAQIEAYEIDLMRDGTSRRLVLNAQKLAFIDGANVHVLVSVADVTEARLAERVKDDLLRDKAVLLQELQHRVANSLQIIASVLLQSARRVQSDETRGYLHDAHSRIMSVASLQRQLAVSQVEDVELRAYFTELCDSIGASMIRDHDKVKLTVDVDESTVHADVSVSLGLIVTELVINALKHAFPDGRSGKILVGYHTAGDGWTLSVTDDGVGMSYAQKAPKAGLGTNIIEALTMQLGAKIEITTGATGTEVAIANAGAIEAARAA